MVNTETMDNTTPSPLLESLVTPKAFDTPVGEEQKVMSVSVTYIMYGVCCFLFLLVTVFLFICKIGLIDADPANRKTSTRWVRGKQRQFLGGTC